MGIEMQFHRHSWNSSFNNITLYLANLVASCQGSKKKNRKIPRTFP